jgi:uncharacterized membrane protein
MEAYLLALLIGVVAGLRAMLVPAVVSWAAFSGIIDLGGTWLAFFERPWMPWLLSLLAVSELVTDQLPSTPSRTVPVQFVTRIVTGSLAGAALATAASSSSLAGAVAGAVGAVVGTLGGRTLRARLAGAFGRDRPAAFIEDALALVASIAIVAVLP